MANYQTAHLGADSQWQQRTGFSSRLEVTHEGQVSGIETLTGCCGDLMPLTSSSTDVHRALQLRSTHLFIVPSHMFHNILYYSAKVRIKKIQIRSSKWCKLVVCRPIDASYAQLPAMNLAPGKGKREILRNNRVVVLT